VVLVAVVGIPLAMPLGDLLTTSDAQVSLWDLAGNTFLLIAGTLAAALPLGTAAAVVLYRTDLPARHFFRFLTVLTLFVPLHVLTTAWQITLGNVGLWTPDERVWAEGLGPTIWIHTQAALPWIILIVGQGLRWVEPELEEDALLAAGPWRVLWSVTLPRSGGSIVAAAVWVTLQIASEVAVADMMLVDTFARKIYNEFILGGGDTLARALSLALPVVALTSIAVYWVLTRLDNILPPLAAMLAEPRPFAMGRMRWPAFAIAFAVIGIMAGVPVGSLVWKTGLVGYPPQWSRQALASRVGNMLLADATLFQQSILTMFISAALVTSVALLLCWLARTSPWFRRFLFFVTALVWSTPGPILGIGLHQTIMWLVLRVPLEPLSVALYDGPSPLPVLWAHLLRFLPLAVVALWPVTRLVPRELSDSMQVDGASPLQELRHLVWPLLRRTWLAVVIVIAALALGEVGAVGMRVETPGWIMFAHVLFDRMHYGQTHDVTALCLALLLIIAAGGGICWIGWRFLSWTITK